MAESTRKLKDELAAMTPEQLRQLKSLTRSARINRVVLEVFDFWTDLVFLASVFVQAKRAAIDYEFDGSGTYIALEWLASTSSAGLPTNGTISSEEDRELFNTLFYAGISMMLINSGWRFILAVYSLRRHGEISGRREWSKWLIGVAVTVFEPKSGLDLIDSVMDKEHIYEDDKKYLKRESRLKASMIFFENLPMFCIQVIYATSSSGSFAIAWYVSTVVTILHLVAQLLELTSVVHRYVFTHNENPLDLRNEIASGVENVRLSLVSKNEKFGEDNENSSMLNETNKPYLSLLNTADPALLYEVSELLGEGSSGVVWRAKHKETGDIVAIKVVPVDEGADLSELLREIEILQKSDSPFYGAYRKDANLWLVMELREAGSANETSDGADSVEKNHEP